MLSRPKPSRRSTSTTASPVNRAKAGVPGRVAGSATSFRGRPKYASSFSPSCSSSALLPVVCPNQVPSRKPSLSSRAAS
jgi:hypothetical protein